MLHSPTMGRDAPGVTLFLYIYLKNNFYSSIVRLLAVPAPLAVRKLLWLERLGLHLPPGPCVPRRWHLPNPHREARLGTCLDLFV